MAAPKAAAAAAAEEEITEAVTEAAAVTRWITRQACVAFRKSSGCLAAAPPRRASPRRASEDATAQELQKTVSAVDDAFAALVCPITKNLPINPVTAEDGKVYERKAIAEWLQKELCDGTRTGVTALKYGNNPQQKPASVRGVLSPSGPRPLPFDVLCGTPGYINLLDALNAWQLVKELGAATGLPAAASFKHVSPAGAAVYAPLDEEMMKVYEAAGKELSQTAIAYLRSRQADPLCSFGDFVAVSCEVDLSTAQLLKIEVSDGIIAPSYAPEALEILKAKKGGKYIVLQADANYEPPAEEQRVVYGTDMRQARAAKAVDAETLANVVTADKSMTDGAKRDLLVAQIAIKYTQSNSVGYAKDGQMVGVGAGQQSRVDCVKLAGRKVATWYLRQHPKVRALAFNDGVKRQERINARVRYIEGDMPPTEYAQWLTNFSSEPEPLYGAWMSSAAGSKSFISQRSHFGLHGVQKVSSRSISHLSRTGGISVSTVNVSVI